MEMILRGTGVIHQPILQPTLPALSENYINYYLIYKAADAPETCKN